MFVIGNCKLFITLCFTQAIMFDPAKSEYLGRRPT